MLGLQQLPVGGDNLPVEALAAGDEIEITRQIRLSVGQQVNAVSQPFQFPHQIRHALHRQQVIPPPVQRQIPGGAVQALRQTGAHGREPLLKGDGSPIQLDPLNGAEDLLQKRRTIRLRDALPFQKHRRLPVDQHLAHVKNHIADHEASSFAGCLENRAFSRSSRFRRLSFSSSLSPRSRAPTP